ncbi:uncharacterized protein [Euwallacea similis]|uniref:uncharacterized protein n=1 Tax=Euwallacea similis TaxID=1736056 RepID=UPI00344D2580
MIALKFIPIAQLLLIFFTYTVLSYPTSSYYNTKHFRQSSHRPVYDPYEYYSRSQRYPYGYYPAYSQIYPDEYYYNLDPLYYISPRVSKYDFYQTGLPYYQEPIARGKYYGEGSVEDSDKLWQDLEREQRERAQPIGHEIRYDTDYSEDEGSVDETNAAFLNNLMLQQLYLENAKDKLPASYYDQYSDYNPDEVELNRWNDVPYDHTINVDDEEVKELKELPKKQKERKNRQRKQRKVKSNNEKRNDGEDVVVFTDRKPVIKDPAPSAAPDLLTDGSRRNIRGQKEEVMMRPATPVRHPFSDSVLDMLSQQDERKRSPSVYDKIRHLLEMEKNAEDQTEPKPEMKPSMRKRIVSSEDSLTRQLTVLKKQTQ